MQKKTCEQARHALLAATKQIKIITTAQCVRLFLLNHNFTFCVEQCRRQRHRSKDETRKRLHRANFITSASANSYFSMRKFEESLCAFASFVFSKISSQLSAYIFVPVCACIHCSPHPVNCQYSLTLVLVELMFLFPPCLSLCAHQK